MTANPDALFQKGQTTRLILFNELVYFSNFNNTGSKYPIGGH